MVRHHCQGMLLFPDTCDDKLRCTGKGLEASMRGQGPRTEGHILPKVGLLGVHVATGSSETPAKVVVREQ